MSPFCISVAVLALFIGATFGLLGFAVIANAGREVPTPQAREFEKPNNDRPGRPTSLE